jgi:hypothetical protein
MWAFIFWWNVVCAVGNLAFGLIEPSSSSLIVGALNVVGATCLLGMRFG